MHKQTTRDLVNQANAVALQILRDGRSKFGVKDVAWLNTRLQMSNIIQNPDHVEKGISDEELILVAMSELSSVVSMLGKYSTVPLADVFSLFEKAGELIGEQNIIGQLVTNIVDFESEEGEGSGVHILVGNNFIIENAEIYCDNEEEDDD